MGSWHLSCPDVVTHHFEGTMWQTFKDKQLRLSEDKIRTMIQTSKFVVKAQASFGSDQTTLQIFKQPFRDWPYAVVLETTIPCKASNITTRTYDCFRVTDVNIAKKMVAWELTSRSVQQTDCFGAVGHGSDESIKFSKQIQQLDL